MAEDGAPAASRQPAPSKRSATRPAVNGRSVSQRERVAAARARVSADKKRGATTATWIIELAEEQN